MKFVFEGGGEIVIINVLGDQITFSNSTLGLNHFAPIEGIALKKAGILKEHPDLEGKPLEEMRKIAIERFKKKLLEMDTNDKMKEYIIKEMTEMTGVGYKYKYHQKPGWRPQK